MVEIAENFIDINEFSRPGRKRRETLGIVMHWTANPMTTATANRNYFDGLKNGGGVYASAHYIVGLDGEIVQCMPDDEVAYHCGSSRPDPRSGKVYTDLARRLFGGYASERNSPNNCTVGIELCCTDMDGLFRKKTLDAAAGLVAMLLKKYDVPHTRIVTHHEVVGWKDCPRLWTENPSMFDEFVADVRARTGS